MPSPLRGENKNLSAATPTIDIALAKVIIHSYFMNKVTILLSQLTVAALISLSLSFATLSESEERPTRSATASSVKFYTLWKSMKPEIREQFLSAYLQGWSDAGSIHKLALDALEKNPAAAAQTFETLTPMYDTSDVTPHDLAEAIDNYFKDENTRAVPLGRVIAIARGHLTSGE